MKELINYTNGAPWEIVNTIMRGADTAKIFAVGDYE